MATTVSFKKIKSIQADVEGSSENLKITADVTINEEKRITSGYGELRKPDGNYLGTFSKMDIQRCSVDLQDMNVDFDVFAEVKAFLLEVESNVQTIQGLTIE